MGEKLPRILPKLATSTSLLGFFTSRKFTTWDRLLYFPSEGRRAEDFFARKVRRLRPGLNPRTRVPEANTLTSRPPKPLYVEVTQRYVIDTHQRFRAIFALTFGVVLLTTSWIEAGCSRFLPYLLECDPSPATTILTFKYSRVSFCDGSFYDDSLLRSLSSRTEHSRLVVHHCRNSSVLSLLIELLALFRCACVYSFSTLVHLF